MKFCCMLFLTNTAKNASLMVNMKSLKLWHHQNHGILMKSCLHEFQENFEKCEERIFGLFYLLLLLKYKLFESLEIFFYVLFCKVKTYNHLILLKYVLQQLNLKCQQTKTLCLLNSAFEIWSYNSSHSFFDTPTL